MKILLAACNAKYIHSNLAVYNLMAYAQEYSEYLILKEYTINQIKDDILRDIYLSEPDVVCFSCYIWNISFIRELVSDLAKILPETVFWAGGPEVSYSAECFLEENPEFTGVMVGEGEATFRELVRFYAAREHDEIYHESYTGKDAARENGLQIRNPSLGDITGIVYKDEIGIHHNGWREILDLSTVPFAYEHLEDFKNRIIYYETSRGCPFSCSYCLSSVEKKLRFRDMKLVKKELQFFIDHKVPQVKFVDRTFNCKHEHAMEIWKYIKEHDNGVTNFHFEVSADLLREEELELMSDMRPGLIQLEIGVQSTNPETIRAIRRTMNLEKLERLVERVHSFENIHQHLDLIAGLPYEDLASFKKSFNDVYRMKPEQLQLGFLKVLKGSYMMECVQEYEIQYKSREPYEVLSTKWLNFREILQLKMVESMVEVYYNSGQFKETLEFLLPYFKDAYSFYESLGEFYAERGYSEISHSRMRRYEILLEFLEQYPEISKDAAIEKMMFDLYLRENLKSRPAFAPSQKEYEKEIWEYRRLNKIAKTAHVEVMRDGRMYIFDYENRDPLSHNAQVKEVNVL